MRNSGGDSELFRGPGPASPGITLPDQRRFRGPGRGVRANGVETEVLAKNTHFLK